MSNITASQVKELRSITGAGMMECKQALVATDGDLEKAIDFMRKAGQAKVAKKAGRIAAEGIIALEVSEDSAQAIMVEVNTETDFVARDDNFTSFVEKIVTRGLVNRASALDALLNLPLDDGTIANAREALIAKLGENINIRRVVFLEAQTGIIGSYCHGGRIGVLLNLSVDDAALAKDLAMHIAASKPEVIAPEDLTEEVVAKEREIYIAQAEQSGKSREIIEKMIAGKINKFKNEVSLLGQPFVKDPETKVATLLKAKNAKVLSFVRFEVGEGIEKKQMDFAQEVMQQVQGAEKK